MKADPISVGKVLSENHRFIVPIYQRTYGWSEKGQLEPLFDQIEAKAQERILKGKADFPHYMGSLLVIPEGEPAFGRVQAFDVVDGQQRLTTFHLCFAALREISRSRKFEDLTKNLEILLLYGDDAPISDKKNERYKLQPSAYDRMIFRDMIDLNRDAIKKAYSRFFYKNGNIMKGAGTPTPLAAYWFFLTRAEMFLAVAESEARSRLLALTDAIFQNFQFIVITLSKDDDPQVIFATLNSGGKPLAAMDLVRNDVFLRAARMGEDEEKLMSMYWQVFEDPFWKQERTQGRMKKPLMDFFLAHALAAETGELVSLTEIYAEYKRFTKQYEGRMVAEELASITRYVPVYRGLVDPQAGSPLSKLAHRLEVFDLSTAYPLILLIAISDAADHTKETLYSLIGSYVIRRAICGLTAKNYNIAFIEFAAHMRERGVSVESFAAVAELRKNSEAAKLPADADLRDAVINRSQYDRIPRHRLRLIIEELELASRDKFSATGDLLAGLSVEHIMPREWRREWPLPSGRFAPERGGVPADEAMAEEIATRDRLIHTLANLSLLTPPGNSSAGNASFEMKKGRLRDSLLRMNAEVADNASWQEPEIHLRARKLASLATKVWYGPHRRRCKTFHALRRRPEWPKSLRTTRTPVIARRSAPINALAIWNQRPPMGSL